MGTSPSLEPTMTAALLTVPIGRALALALWFAVSMGMAGAEFDPLLEMRIAEAEAAAGVDAALDVINSELARNDDAAVSEDLLSRRAELLEAAGRHAEAAQALWQLAEAVSERAGMLAPELAPILRRASELYATAGDAEGRASALAALLPVLDAAGLEEEAGRVAAVLVEAGLPIADEALAAHAARNEKATSRGSPVAPDEGFTTVRIFYATDRARSGAAAPIEFYGGQRGGMDYGTAEISIPDSHRPGQIEKPSIWTLDFREDPERHVVLRSVTPAEPDAFFDTMQRTLRSTGSDEAFVFVHGFNVPFHEAAERTAQMAYDMNFGGLPILFSWPSRGSVLSYIADTAVVNLSGRRLSLFLEDVVQRSGARRIHLIGHSMGNRALTDALELYALRQREKLPSFDQVLFTAPDLDAGLFAEMVRTIRPAANRVTLYASDKDWALAVSRKLHGNAVRAGQGGQGIVRQDGIDSIDMTEIGEDMLAHSYYANNPSALTDMLALFWRDAPPDQRCGMRRLEGEGGVYWRYDPATCDSGALLSTLSYLRRGSVRTLGEARAFLNRFVMPVTADPVERTRLTEALARLFGG
jgi:esterase/lipase superfamily enzyme